MGGDIFRKFVFENCNTNEEFLALRKEICYNFSTAWFLNFILNNTSAISDYYIDSVGGNLYVDNV